VKTKKRAPATAGKPTTPEHAPEPTSSTPVAPAFPVVGIGASAGGLAAIEEFLAALPTDGSLEMAFVLLQHLDPDHKSLLLDLVRRYTKMEVEWAADGVKVKPGCTYILPPNKSMSLVDGRLVLAKPAAPRGLRLPIDHFLRSLAADQHERAVCIILSGTGSDGTLGARAIKGEGGMVIAQSLDSAAYDGMPRSAIATGVVDYVLAPAEMPEQLLGYVSRAFRTGPRLAPAAETPTEDPLLDVLRVLRDRSGHDFTHYKASTLHRRVERRMAVNKIDRLEDYTTLLERDSLESETLFRELLIGVTSFFRDPPAFEALATKVLRTLVDAHSSGDPVRVWVPGCSTGEEAYSIAMLALEAADECTRGVPVQIFATDIDAEAIERARAGVYPASISADVSPKRLARFFTDEGDTCLIAKDVRDCVVFAKQDVTKDPPFSKVDLISCRNLLIYMDAVLQQRLMPLFHYALNPDGYLFLGGSETVGASASLFAPVDKKWRLFKRKDSVTPPQLLATVMPPREPAAAGTRSSAPEAAPLRVRVRDLAEKALLDRHAPACVVVNAEGEVLYIHGHTGRYLEPASGEPTGSLFKMARDGLRFEITAGVHKVLAQKVAVRYERLHVKNDGGVSLVNLTIEPLLGPDSAKGVLMVLFEDVASSGVAGTMSPPETAPDREQRIADLDRELTAKEDYLRSTVEELETTNEELKSTNEEMQSSNEELQSTNEEMETSREELQSLNEELTTVNSELQEKIVEASRATNDMSNMIAGTGIGTMFVDEHMLIQRFTPRVTEIMNLIPSDIGRPIGDISLRLTGDADLVAAVTTVLDTLATVDAQVEDGTGRVYQMRVQPYRTLDNVIEGAVLTFVDITEQRALQDKLDELAVAVAETGEFAQSVLDTVREPQLVLDGNLTVVTANKSFMATFQGSPKTIVGRPLSEVYSGTWLTPELRGLLLDVLPKKKRLGDFELRLIAGKLGRRTVTLNALELVRKPKLRRLILLTITDIGEDI
jgi:two-component system CheB/CheR fusion protein